MKIDRSLIILILSIAGMGLGIFLIYHHYFGAEICNINSYISCDTVNKSIYSEVYHIPVAAFGLGYFALVALLVLLKKKILYVFVLSLVAIVPSIALTYIELFVLHAICVFCESTKIVIVAIIIVSYVSWKKEMRANEKANRE